MVTIGSCSSESIGASGNTGIIINSSRNGNCIRVPLYVFITPLVFLFIIIIMIIGYFCYRRRRQTNLAKATMMYSPGTNIDQC